jgi:hypothetical protein
MENKVSKTVTVTLVNISDVYDHLGLTDYEVEHIADVAWSNVSYGDAQYTLVGNVFALDQMLEAYEHYHKNVIANKSMTRDDFANKFWEIVGEADYINLEF